MKKETRHNLIFLVLFLAISLPGAAMLFRAKLDPDARIMYLPPSVRKTLAYMVPHATAGDVVRTQPAEVMRFVEERLMHGSPQRKPLRRDAAGGRQEPILSSGRNYELLDIQYLGGTVTVYVLLWNPGEGTQQHALGSVAIPGQWEGRIDSAKTRTLPEDIREVLREHGYTNPPSRVTWMKIQCIPRVPGVYALPDHVPPQLMFDPDDSSPFLPRDVLELPDIPRPAPNRAG